MDMKLPYCKTSEAIKGYQESVIAKGERNDCVVRAFASSFDIPYDESHTYCEKVLHRKHRDGVKNFVVRLETLVKKNEVINGKKFNLVGKFYSLYYDVKIKNKKIKRALTVGKFIKDNPIGTFLVSVRGHAFTIKNGVVIGNVEDAKKTRRVLQSIWKIV